MAQFPISLVVLLLLSLTALANSSRCLAPTGIDDGTPSALSSSALNLPVKGVAKSYMEVSRPVLNTFEGSIQFHSILSLGMSFYSTVAAFEDKALDPWARKDVSDARRRCKPAKGQEDIYSLHRRASIAYATLMTAKLNLPLVYPVVKELATAQGLDVTKCEGESSLDEMLSTPWGLGCAVASDIYRWRSRDGWNAAGDVKLKFNPKPFSDWRDEPYTPVNSPWEISDIRRWQPLLEGNDKGYYFHQQLVTTQIGEAGKSLYIGDEELCRRSLDDPNYDLEEELYLALEKSANLDEKKKATIELFDNKLTSILILQQQYFSRVGLDSDDFEFWVMDFSIMTALYESTLLVWDEKIRHDLVRPPTVAQYFGAGKTATSYSRAARGIREMPVDQWEPFIRTMPHAEYPSASSCACEVSSEIMKLHRGNDDFESVGGTLEIVVPAGSSKVEPGSPAQNLTLSYTSWSEVSAVCGESRLDGGMHFRASVPAGQKLCRGLGEITLNAVRNLAEGKVPPHVANLESPIPRQKRCSSHETSIED